MYERTFGKMHRVVLLPKDAENEDFSFYHKDGVLVVSVRKAIDRPLAMWKIPATAEEETSPPFATSGTPAAKK